MWNNSARRDIFHTSFKLRVGLGFLEKRKNEMTLIHICGGDRFDMK
jgi:hypothetical protein